MNDNGLNKTISTLTGILVSLLAIGSFALSYNALRGMANDIGLTGWQSYIWPLLVDFALITFSLAVVRASLQGERTTWPWTLVGIYSLATLVFNVLHAPADLTARVIAAVAPVSLFLSFELLMSQVRTEVIRAGIISTLEQLSQLVSKRKDELSQLDTDLAQRTQERDTIAQQRDTIKAQIDELTKRKGELENELKSVSFGPNDTSNDTDMSQANDTRQAQIDARRNQVLNLLSEGMSQADIANELSVSIATIKRDTKALNGSVQS